VNTPVKFESMRRVVKGIALAGLLGLVAGCAGQPASGGGQVMTRPSTQDLDIDFVADPSTQPKTRIVVRPMDGDVSLEAVVEAPGKDDPNKNRVIWTADRSFAILFRQIDDPTKIPSRKFGNETDGWNPSKPVGKKHVYRLKLSSGRGSGDKTIVGAKYFVKSPADCDESKGDPNCLVLDPVLIVRY
jgi:hypothetical protein